jgi:hypothetical protein
MKLTDITYPPPLGHRNPKMRSYRFSHWDQFVRSSTHSMGNCCWRRTTRAASRPVLQVCPSAFCYAHWGPTLPPQADNHTKCPQRSGYPYPYSFCKTRLKENIHTYLSTTPGHHSTSRGSRLKCRPQQTGRFYDPVISVVHDTACSDEVTVPCFLFDFILYTWCITWKDMQPSHSRM